MEERIDRKAFHQMIKGLKDLIRNILEGIFTIFFFPHRASADTLLPLVQKDASAREWKQEIVLFVMEWLARLKRSQTMAGNGERRISCEEQVNISLSRDAVAAGKKTPTN